MVPPAAIESSGRWGEGMVIVFKMAVALASQEGKNDNGQFAFRGKRRIIIAARRGMMYQAFASRNDSRLTSY